MIKEERNPRIGIFGGSFDPIHLGHIGLAEDAMQQAKLSKVIFVPVKRQPFKLDKDAASGKDRMNMIAAALKSRRDMEISRYELDANGISYTYLTLRAMRQRFGKNTMLYFITGTDAFLQIRKWKNAREILNDYAFIVGIRPGYREEELAACIDDIRKNHTTEVIRINNTQVDVSSTEIRQRINAGLPAADLIPVEVERYIIEHGLYRQQ